MVSVMARTRAQPQVEEEDHADDHHRAGDADVGEIAVDGVVLADADGEVAGEPPAASPGSKLAGRTRSTTSRTLAERLAALAEVAGEDARAHGDDERLAVAALVVPAGEAVVVLLLAIEVQAALDELAGDRRRRVVVEVGPQLAGSPRSRSGPARRRGAARASRRSS